MGYVDSNLIAGESILYRAHLHWYIFVWPIIVMLLGVPFAGASDTACVFLLISGLGMLLLLRALVIRSTSEFAVTSRRVFLKTGFIRRQSLELPLPKIESVRANQGILARMLGYGSVVVTGTGGTNQGFGFISNPQEFRRRVQTTMLTA